MTTTLESPGGNAAWSDEERDVLSMLVYLPSSLSAPPLRHLRRAIDVGGELDDEACTRLLEDCATVRSVLFPWKLEAWTPKYGSNTLLGSKACFALLARHKLRYLNRNVDPPAVFAGRKRSDEDAQTLAELPELRTALTILETLARTPPLRITHERVYAGF